MRFLIQEKIKKGERIEIIISYVLLLSLVGAVIFLLYRQSWLNAFLTAVILGLSLFPSILRRNYHIHLPVEIDFLVIIFIYAALFLGEVNSFYHTVWWWDLALHFSSGILLGITGFLLVHALNKDRKIHVHLGRKFVSLFSFSFAIAIGVLWEIFEFFMDYTFGFNMTKSGLPDTITDLIVNTLGAGIVAIGGYMYSLKSSNLFLDKIIHYFLSKDLQLLKKKRTY